MALPRIGAHLRQRPRHVHGEFVRRRELAVDIAGAAGVAEIGEVFEVAVGEVAAHSIAGNTAHRPSQ
jgi:hypothetical protein